MRVLVYGGREWDDQETMDRVLDTLHEQYGFTEVIEGGQVSYDKANFEHMWGADYQARQWATGRRINIRTFMARWRQEGLAAGPIRNQRMIDEGKPEIAVHFPGGRGTTDMSRRLEAAGIQIIDALTVKISTIPS